MADEEFTITVTEQELELLKRALSEHEAKRSSMGLSTDEAEALQKKLNAAK
jgi:hypothetical protein